MSDPCDASVRLGELSLYARHLWFIADRARLPGSGVVLFPRLVKEFGFSEDLLWDCFEELCIAEVVPPLGVTTVIPFHGEPPNVGRLEGTLWLRRRAEVFERDNFTCRYCGSKPERLQCDHVVPVVRGGSNETDNLATACKPCNQSKCDKLVSEWRP